jgi:cyclic pyranopterin phosphate synthase
VDIEFSPEAGTFSVLIQSRVRTEGKTGVEMEALVAAAAAALTIYDMCKAVDRGMVVQDLLLLEKKGGASGVYCAASPGSSERASAS